MSRLGALFDFALMLLALPLLVLALPFLMLRAVMDWRVSRQLSPAERRAADEAHGIGCVRCSQQRNRDAR